MSKPFLARLGHALSAFATPAPVRTGAELAPLQKSGAPFPFNKIPLIDSGGGGDKLQRPYENSVWVQRAIKKVAAPIASLDLCFRDPATDKEIEDEPWVDFWQRPMRGMTRNDFIEAAVSWLKLCGECFIILPPEFTMPFPDAVKAWPQLVMIRPDRIRAIKDGAQLVDWEITGDKGNRLVVAPEQVIQPKFWNPYDDLRGMSEYEAAHVAAEADYLAGKFALNLARANGDTGVIIAVANGGQLDTAQQEQITNSLRMKRQKSLRGEFSSIFIPASLEVKDPQIKSPDAEFVAQRLENRHEIYIAFGVPPSMADVVASYSIGSASDRYLLIEDTCIPTGAKLCEALSNIASRQAGRPVEAYFDWDEHPVLQQVRRERLDAGVKLFGCGVPWREISDYLDLDLPTFAGDDQGYLPATLLPVDSAAAVPPEVNPAYAEGETDPVQEALKALRARLNPASSNEHPASPPCECCSLELSDLQIRERDSKEIKLWKSIVARRRETIRAFESKFNRVLFVARAEVIRKLEKQIALEKAVTTRAVSADFLFDLADFTKLFQASMRGVQLTALQAAGDQVFAELKKDDPWKLPQAETIDFLKARQNKLSGVPEEVFGRIRDTIQDGLTNGDPLRTIADAVRAEFNDLSVARARVIAQTETAAAYGYGRHEAMSAAGIQFKQWLTSGNANVRAAHQLMNGDTIAIDENFVVVDPRTGDSDEIMHPGDSDGEPWNVINCHCVEIASAEGPPEPES